MVAAAALIALWLPMFLKGTPASGYFPPIFWHGHEMIYGFVAAIVIGFIYTASQNWTGTPGIRGVRLVVLAGLWLAARVLMAAPVLPHGAIAAVDLAFLPVAEVFLIPYLGRKEQRHNIIFLVLLTALTTGNLLMHLSALGVLPGFERQGLYLGLDVVLLMIVVISGRIIPMFSERAVAGYARRPAPWLDRLALATTAAFLIADFAGPVSGITAGIALSAAAVHLARWVRWFDRGVWRLPILWILYVGYAWLVVGFGLRGLTSLTPIPISAATHAFTVGAIGTMIVAMVSRVSLGHTGRKISASKLTVLSYLSISSAAAVRVAGAISATWLDHSIVLLISGALWIAAFMLLLMTYAPILAAPRADGRPG
jgi:uncharacterized protein involved in response to NO